MNSIGNISGVNSLSYVSPTTNASPSVGGGDSDGDRGSRGGAGGVGKANFMSAIEQALGQSFSGGTTSTSAVSSSTDPTATAATQDPQAALQSFLHNLFAALHQSGGQGNAPTVGGDKDSDGDGDGAGAVSGGGRHRGGANMTSNLQSLLQQLSAGTQNASPAGQSSGNDALAGLNSSFQSLIASIGSSQGGATASPTLQSFLQNLQQDLSNGQNISGALLSTKA